jgi:hypothetical protein
MPGGGEYVVKPGDSLSKIAKQYVAKVDTATKDTEKSDVDKQIEKDKANPQNNPIAAQIEKDKANPQNTPPKKDGQSGQVVAPAEKPPAISVPPVQVSQNDFDPNRAVDAKRPSGFDWGKIRTQADTDYSTGDIGYKPDGSMGIRTPFKRNTQAIPQTGGVFNQTGFGSDANKELGKDVDTTKPGWKLSDNDQARILWLAGLGPEPKTEKPTTVTPSPEVQPVVPPAPAPAPRPRPNTSIPPNLRN